MKILPSRTDDNRVYLFDEFMISTDKMIEEGHTHSQVKGYLVYTLEASLTYPDYRNNKELMDILNDCIDPSFLKNQDEFLKHLKITNIPFKSLGYTEQLLPNNPKYNPNENRDTIYIHIVDKD